MTVAALFHMMHDNPLRMFDRFQGVVKKARLLFRKGLPDPCPGLIEVNHMFFLDQMGLDRFILRYDRLLVSVGD